MDTVLRIFLYQILDEKGQNTSFTMQVVTRASEFRVHLYCITFFKSQNKQQYSNWKCFAFLLDFQLDILSYFLNLWSPIVQIEVFVREDVLDLELNVFHWKNVQ